MSDFLTFPTGIHTNSFPSESIITNPSSTAFSPSTWDTAYPAGIIATFPFLSVYGWFSKLARASNVVNLLNSSSCACSVFSLALLACVIIPL